MTVKELIELLEKVECKAARVFYDDPDKYANEICNAVVEHNLNEDVVTVVMKS